MRRVAEVDSQHELVHRVLLLLRIGSELRQAEMGGAQRGIENQRSAVRGSGGSTTLRSLRLVGRYRVAGDQAMVVLVDGEMNQRVCRPGVGKAKTVRELQKVMKCSILSMPVEANDLISAALKTVGDDLDTDENVDS